MDISEMLLSVVDGKMEDRDRANQTKSRLGNRELKIEHAKLQRGWKIK